MECLFSINKKNVTAGYQSTKYRQRLIYGHIANNHSRSYDNVALHCHLGEYYLNPIFGTNKQPLVV